MSFAAFLFGVFLIFGAGSYNECALSFEDGVTYEVEELENETRRFPDNNCEE